jgi:hypothetical protein
MLDVASSTWTDRVYARAVHVKTYFFGYSPGAPARAVR